MLIKDQFVRTRAKDNALVTVWVWREGWGRGSAIIATKREVHINQSNGCQMDTILMTAISGRGQKRGGDGMLDSFLDRVPLSHCFIASSRLIGLHLAGSALLISSAS